MLVECFTGNMIRTRLLAEKAHRAGLVVTSVGVERFYVQVPDDTPTEYVQRILVQRYGTAFGITPQEVSCHN